MQVDPLQSHLDGLLHLVHLCLAIVSGAPQDYEEGDDAHEANATVASCPHSSRSELDSSELG